MTRRYPITSFPNGWYAVCKIEEVKEKKVVPIRALGRDLVAFQTESGAINVLDAHCPHQGAHLGHGGTIKGESIECPFHKWCFDGAGKCQNIPYSKNMPKGKKSQLHSYPTVQRLGFVIIYHSNDYSPPAWEVPKYEEDAVGNWTEPAYAEMIIDTHVLEFAENGFDLAHFEPVHRSEKNQITLDKKQPFGPEIFFALDLVYPGDGMGLFGKKIGVHVDWRYSGLGLLDNRVTMNDYPTEIRQYFFITPIEEEKCRVQVCLRINKDKIKLINPLRYLVLKLIEKQNLKILVQNFEEDRPIWENKRFREPPILCEGDGPIAHTRIWMKQFYTQPEEARL